jgi:two-component system LytT family response regulator
LSCLILRLRERSDNQNGTKGTYFNLRFQILDWRLNSLPLAFPAQIGVNQKYLIGNKLPVYTTHKSLHTASTTFCTILIDGNCSKSYFLSLEVNHMFYERKMKSASLSLRTLVVDSDPHSRKLFVNILSRDPAVESVEECENGLDAIAAIRDFKPDLLICEVETPGIHGFALLETIPAEDRPATIFVSNRDQFAARAFEVSAADYLMKPIGEERVLRALERARKQIERGRNQNSSSAGASGSRQLAIKTGRCVFFVKTDELDWVEAEGKYVRLHMGKESLLLKMSITSLESELDPRQFVRIHRSTIINSERVRWVQPYNHGRTYQIILQDGTRLVLSRKSKLRELTGTTKPGLTENASAL